MTNQPSASKYSQVQRWIETHYNGEVLAGNVMWRIACECECAISTVYRATNKLIAVGAVDAQKRYTGRQFVPPAEIARYADCDRLLLLTEEKMSHMTRELYAAPGAVWAGIRWGLMRSDFEQLNGLPRAMLLRVKKLA